MSERVQSGIRGRVATVTLNRPEARNAIDTGMWGLLGETINQLAGDGDIRVLVIGGSDPGFFSAGADLKEYARIAGQPSRVEASYRAMRGAIDGLAAFPWPTIARLSGPVMGAGVALALAADIRLGSETAVFAVTPAKIGLLYPPPDIKRLARTVGPAFAREMLFTARKVAAAEAERRGLLNRIVPGDDLAVEVSRLAGEIAARAPSSLKGLKRLITLLEAGADGGDAEAERRFLEAYGSDDFAKGLAAFGAGRDAEFSQVANS